MPQATVQQTAKLAAPPAQVWAVLRDFAAPWHPDMAWCREEIAADGARERVFAMTGEDGRYRERLTYFSDAERSLSYVLTEGIEGAQDYRARVRVEAAEGGAAVSWSARIIATAARLEPVRAGTEAILRRGLEALPDLAREAAPPAPDTPPQGGAEVLRHHIGGTPRLSYLTTGLPDTPPEALIVFLHGIGGNATNWTAQLETLGARHPVAALDMRGYGESTLGFLPSQIDDYCEDLLQLARAFRARKLLLCGLSMGSWIATSFAMRHPEKLAGLILAGGCTGMSEADPDERETFRVSREVPLSQGQSPADFAPAVVDVIAGPDAGPEVRRALLDSMAAIPAASYRDALNCFCNPMERFDFARIDCPVLMVTGEHDRLAPPEEIRAVSYRIHDAIEARGGWPDVRFEVLEGAGHLCNLEAPEAFNRLADAFLTRLLGSGEERRPSREDRRRAKSRRILDAALAEFCARGFDGASMNAIAERAGVSKPTLYQYFGDKDGLFDAVLDEGRVVLLAPLGATQGDLVDRLWQFAWTYADFVLRPDMLSLARLILGEAERRPESAVAYHRSGPGRAFAGIVTFVGEMAAAGRLEVDDAELAAQDLWSLILSGPRDHYLHHVRERPDRASLARHITHGLRVFLTVYSARPDADLAELERHAAAGAQTTTGTQA
jgi:pimeloyl-ACP methyl ester carboxylesterase/AcrR family transcriptional regulator